MKLKAPKVPGLGRGLPTDGSVTPTKADADRARLFPAPTRNVLKRGKSRIANLGEYAHPKGGKK
jgi:hypothetical protein